jgi:high-affinity iron transporter
MPKDSLVASLLGGTIGFDTTTSWFQLIIWAAYLGLVIAAYLSKPAKVKTLIQG